MNNRVNCVLDYRNDIIAFAKIPLRKIMLRMKSAQVKQMYDDRVSGDGRMKNFN